MQVNTLVTHRLQKFSGIGCISKISAKKAQVNFGLESVMVCSLSALNEVDTSICKTMTLQELKRKTISNSPDLNYVIIGNELRQWVGIGLVIQRVVTYDDLKKYSRVIQ